MISRTAFLYVRDNWYDVNFEIKPDTKLASEKPDSRASGIILASRLAMGSASPSEF